MNCSMNSKFSSMKDKLYSAAANLGILKVSQRFFLKRDCNNRSPEFKKCISLRIRPISLNDIAFISKKLNIDFRSEIDDSDGGMVATVGDNLVHWSLFACSTYHNRTIDAPLRFCSDSAFIHNVYTVPEYRGLGIAPRVIDAICQYLYSEGRKKVYLTVFEGNIPSMNAVYQAGFRKIGAVNYVKIFPLRLYRITANSKTNLNVIKKMALTDQKGIDLLHNKRKSMLLDWHRNLNYP